MFNPSEHMMKLKGKDYLQVAWRLVWFRDSHPDWAINTDCVEQDAEHAVFKCIICDENGLQKSAGHGSESKRDFGDFLEKAETKAVGRALAMLGFGTQFTGGELDEGERIVDSPIDLKPKEVPKDAVESKNDSTRMGVIDALKQRHNIGNNEFNAKYRAYCAAVWKMDKMPLISSLTDTQFDEMILAINDELKKGA